MIQKILVPVDGSKPSRTALEFACELCKKFDAELSIVHVVKDDEAERVVMVMGTSRVALPADPEKVAEAGQSVIDAATEVVESAGCRVTSATSVVGAAAKQILAFADDTRSDTIVMGSRGLSDIGGLMLGSVSHKVSHLASCTCIVVR